jgi:glycosyltransferase involved in cell wall biosynthesis
MRQDYLNQLNTQHIYLMRIIVPAIPHTVTNSDYVACAFTQKVRKFVKMMSGRGHEVYHVGHVDSDIHVANDVHQVSVIDNNVLRQSYGDAYVDQHIWKYHGFGKFFKSDDVAHQHFNSSAIAAIAPLITSDTVIVGFWGYGHKPIADAFPAVPFIEGGIGYLGAFSQWRVYESNAVMCALATPEAVVKCLHNWYHRVIPNYFDPDDFDYADRSAKEDYLLYLGRVIESKGVDIAIQAAEAAGKKLLIAGQGQLSDLGYKTNPPHVQYVGYADPLRRRMLLAKAAGLIIASKYLEPFAGVQVEAWLSGTPTVTPDHSAFAEYNHHNVSGYRCRMFRHFVEACAKVQLLDTEACRAHGEKFTLSAVAPLYDDYLQDVLDVYHDRGWYSQR